MSVNEVKIKPAPVQFELRGTGPPTSRTFVIGDEDHTLGNALRHILINDARVDFAGYCVPHPSEPVVHVRVQTATGNEGAAALTATEAVKEACTTLENQCDFVLEELEKVLPEVREDREWMEQLAAEELQQAAEEEEDEED
ncbi:DNA-directed RNA polymerases I and III subunit RPAC2 [Skeletonema marinoi]|uniref:DNA-directed RNA polymerases I and III subunit RPAC2 n=1 Tax=Skeletonema marinoi TaxID=267567 RepID=A0AAD8Y969_9STRA|nr:DNA-directed RNA polymerases I and III subunit RPAC2 [Skeletonema marinoi]|mmetsp:Transcript_5449/g.7616  ORF Transcript_5449/g.7616 Transcript_5449/m.7616 type:complete len:141 (+) Transcript_5449:263-685(+)|eukprot:CAMPEP_0113388946 /NCGR_PEP_ID=MMETSP0013_2-20120614/9359_1 /TAXON_ID=2843 ORGANISM="Skeletonema costatum, Strain 1716" /NCGR_SAMPLE_ID=MMETSP0013_2 /ASSEMBLY_ACC=CAM_ASM_000158 /LENGTH=140 /DNA_ID=CAMNT_0000271979 /DNA_START=252 /DNA_END=674 /DNA_ORIENTATION=+ /assembly_acc=CAM_ASM_000158